MIPELLWIKPAFQWSPYRICPRVLCVEDSKLYCTLPKLAHKGEYQVQEGWVADATISAYCVVSARWIVWGRSLTQAGMNGKWKCSGPVWTHVRKTLSPHENSSMHCPGFAGGIVGDSLEWCRSSFENIPQFKKVVCTHSPLLGLRKMVTQKPKFKFNMMTGI